VIGKEKRRWRGEGEKEEGKEKGNLKGSEMN
jgi:hypothetical protein